MPSHVFKWDWWITVGLLFFWNYFLSMNLYLVSLKMVLFIFKKYVSRHINICMRVFVCMSVIVMFVCIFLNGASHRRLEIQIFRSKQCIEKHLLTSKWTLKYIGIRAINSTLDYFTTLFHRLLTESYSLQKIHVLGNITPGICFPLCIMLLRSKWGIF